MPGEQGTAGDIWALLKALAAILQEEPLNNGAWTYVDPRLQTAARQTEHHQDKRPMYAGRAPSSSVATGHKVRSLSCLSVPPGRQLNVFLLYHIQGVHKREIEQFVSDAFNLEREQS